MNEYFIISSLYVSSSESFLFAGLFIGGLLKDTAEGATSTATISSPRWSAGWLCFRLSGSCVKDVCHQTTTSTTSAVVVIAGPAVVSVRVVNVACHVPRMLLGNVLFNGSELLFDLCACQGAGLRRSQRRPIIAILPERVLGCLNFLVATIRA